MARFRRRGASLHGPMNDAQLRPLK